jgi:hypothetical protein
MKRNDFSKQEDSSVNLVSENEAEETAIFEPSRDKQMVAMKRQKSIRDEAQRPSQIERKFT